MTHDRTLTVGTIASGIGGWELGLERAGMRVRWQCEIDPYALRVLARHWPDVTRYGDANAIQWGDVEPVDVLAAGYPCQPFSLAGARGGHDDERNLWPAVRRAIRDLRPRFVLLENVRGHLSLGFDRVLGDLASLGYDAEWTVLPARAFGAPHRRDRLWIVAVAAADSDGDAVRHEQGARPERESSAEHVANAQRERRVGAEPCRQGPGGVAIATEPANARRAWPAADADRAGCEKCDVATVATVAGLNSGDAPPLHPLGPQPGLVDSPWIDWHHDPKPPVPPVRRVDDGVPPGVDLDGIAGPDDSRRIRALGNALIPQCAEWIGRNIVAGRRPFDVTGDA